MKAAASASPVREIRGWHVLAFFVAFFATVTAVLGTMAWFAVTTGSGEEHSAYRRGIRYNDTLAEAARQDALGWRVSTRYAGGKLIVSLVDRAGEPLEATRVEARIGRPATGRFDRTIAFSRSARGVYVADARLDPGAWSLALRLDVGGAPFNETLRVWADETS